MKEQKITLFFHERMLRNLGKDVVQYISTLIDETPEAWEGLRAAFDNYHQAVESKKVEVGKQDVWIEIQENGEEMFLWGIHLSVPQPGSTPLRFRYGKFLTFKSTVAEVFDVLCSYEQGRELLKCGEY